MIEVGILGIYASICIIAASIGCCIGFSIGFFLGRRIKGIVMRKEQS